MPWEKGTLSKVPSRRRKLSPGQKPSSARPTQLAANIVQAIATTEAKVAMVLNERILQIPFLNRKQVITGGKFAMMARSGCGG